MTTSGREATDSDLAGLAGLFGAYLEFYGRSHDPDRVRGYLGDRMSRGESIVHVAERGSELVGFTQCYPTWSSLDLDALWVLEDLFVSPPARKSGVARALLEATSAAASAASACRLVLETQHGNARAIGLYESFGFVRDREFLTYELELPDR